MEFLYIGWIYLKNTSPSLPDKISINISPNPFNSVCKISIIGISGRNNNLKIYDIDGNLVEQFNMGYGESSVIWNATNYQSGLYIASFSNSVSAKLLLIK